jgi:hypothetical protein
MNRRIRNRTYGGVGGRRGDPPPTRCSEPNRIILADISVSHTNLLGKHSANRPKAFDSTVVHGAGCVAVRTERKLRPLVAAELDDLAKKLGVAHAMGVQLNCCPALGSQLEKASDPSSIIRLEQSRAIDRAPVAHLFHSNVAERMRDDRGTRSDRTHRTEKEPVGIPLLGAFRRILHQWIKVEMVGGNDNVVQRSHELVGRRMPVWRDHRDLGTDEHFDLWREPG